MIFFPLKDMKTQDRPTSFPAPKGVIISLSPSLLTVGLGLFKDDCGCPVDAILKSKQQRIRLWKFLSACKRKITTEI